MPIRGSRVNGVALAALGLAADAVLVGLHPGAPTGHHPDSLVVGAATWTAWLVAAYAAAVLAVTGAAAGWTGRSRVPLPLARLTPRALQRFVAVVLSVGVVAAPATGAGAAGSHARRVAQATSPARGDRHLGPLVVGRPKPTDHRSTPQAVVVRPGDCLWSIVAAALPRAAGNARVARAWPQWWSANRAAIGADPDLIHPGDVLTPPRPARTDR